MKAPGKPATGLEQERKLPSGFSAKTDFGQGTMEISRAGTGSVTIEMNSFSSVANVLADIWPDEVPRLEPGSTIRITDGFTGNSSSIVAGAFRDVAAVIGALVTKPGKYLPKAPEESKATSKARKGKAPVQKAAAKKKAEPKATPKAKAAPPPEKPVPNDVPAWFRELPKQITADDGRGGSVELVRRRLALEGPSSDRVKSRSDGTEEDTAWGYEVISAGRHVAWVIANRPERLIVTGVVGDPGYSPSSHKNLTGVTSRLTAIVMPKFFAAAA